MQQPSKNIICVVVTYNRLGLLKEALSAIGKQTYPVRQIIVIDNHSTDGTSDFLASFDGDGRIKSVRMSTNTGGAGGFTEGIKLAAAESPDWIWLMDDDTIPSPTALENLMGYTDILEVGFVCSRVEWTDGSLHMMNKPGIAPDQSAKDRLFGTSGDMRDAATIVTNASFVSLLVRGDMPRKLGLPYKEFFIWCDDSEYTRRITDGGYIGVQTEKSVVLHKTARNYISSLKVVTAADAWKVFYGERNESFIRRKRKSRLSFFFSQINAFRTHAHRIKKRHLPKEEEQALLTASRRGLWAGFTFNPKIEYI